MNSDKYDIKVSAENAWVTLYVYMYVCNENIAEQGGKCMRT